MAKLAEDAETAALDEEIARLRREMEEAFAQVGALTSEPVIAISRMLDAKINEYMRVRK